MNVIKLRNNKQSSPHSRPESKKKDFVSPFTFHLMSELFHRDSKRNNLEKKKMSNLHQKWNVPPWFAASPETFPVVRWVTFAQTLLENVLWQQLSLVEGFTLWLRNFIPKSTQPAQTTPGAELHTHTHTITPLRNDFYSTWLVHKRVRGVSCHTTLSQRGSPVQKSNVAPKCCNFRQVKRGK